VIINVLDGHLQLEHHVHILLRVLLLLLLLLHRAPPKPPAAVSAARLQMHCPQTASPLAASTSSAMKLYGRA
jgi:hypothetical protein